MTRSSSQSGNVFFLILASVAILAGLSWVFTQNSRTSSGALTADQDRIAAQEIIAFGNTLADSVQKLKLRGCANTQLDFANTIWLQVGGAARHSAGHNPNAPATGCSVFSAADGKVTPFLLPQSYTDGTIPGSGTAQGSAMATVIRMPGVGDDLNSELILFYPRMSSQVCLKINELLGVSNPGGVLPTSSGAWAAYVGTFSDGGGAAAATDPTGALTGKTSYCLTFSGTAYFLHTLIAR